MNACLRAALAYLGRGWSALAVCPPHHRRVPAHHLQACRHPGKRPLGAWRGWQCRLPTEEEVRGQWEASPWSNVGVVLGRVSGLVGVDVDGPAGALILGEVSRGDLPPTLAFSTGRGMRLLFRLPAGARVVNHSIRHRGSEVRVLADGCLTVMPPSRHAGGRRYRWQRRRGPGHVGPADPPDWVLHPRRQTPGTAPVPPAGGGPIPEGQRNDRLFRLGCAMRRQGCTGEEILLTLRRVNRRCIPPLEDAELLRIARSCSRYPSTGCQV